MGQGPIAVVAAVKDVNNVFIPVPLNVDANGNLLTVSTGAQAANVLSSLNITAATLIKATPGTIIAISVVVAGSAAGSVNDCATTGTVAAGNKVYSIPNTAGIYNLYFPCLVGIVVTPGTGQTLAVSYQ